MLAERYVQVRRLGTSRLGMSQYLGDSSFASYHRDRHRMLRVQEFLVDDEKSADDRPNGDRQDFDESIDEVSSLRSRFVAL